MARTGALAEYMEDFAALEYLPGWEYRANTIARRAMRSVARYRAVELVTKVPWPVVAAIHSLESGGDWLMGLHCGQRWDRKTTLVPAGRGPFLSWEAAAVDAIGIHPIVWTIGAIGKFLEMYNGGGYLRRGVNSPYLWSGSTAGVGAGKYVADGHYDKDAVSEQVGAMLVLHQIIALGGWDIGGLPWPTQTPPEPLRDISEVETPKDALPLRQGSCGPRVAVLQAAINVICKGDVDFIPLKVDSAFGPKTAAAVRQTIEVD